MRRLCLALFALAATVAPTLAANARCFTSDDGYYDCHFNGISDDGSFEISADGHPTFQLSIDTPGTAYGAAQYEPGGRFVTLPGTYLRDDADGACWDNGDTGTQICAW